MIENENMTTEIIEEVAEAGVEETTNSTSGTNAGLAVLIGGIVTTITAIAIAKGVKRLRAKKQAEMIVRPAEDVKDDDITEDNLDIEDIEP